jgi:hypothetical protein
MKPTVTNANLLNVRDYHDYVVKLARKCDSTQDTTKSILFYSNFYRCNDINCYSNYLSGTAAISSIWWLMNDSVEQCEHGAWSMEHALSCLRIVNKPSSNLMSHHDHKGNSTWAYYILLDCHRFHSLIILDIAWWKPNVLIINQDR